MRGFAIAFSVVTIIFVAILGFHWIVIGTKQERRLCVMTKDRMTFDLTALSADSEITFALEHPILWTRLARHEAECVHF